MGDVEHYCTYRKLSNEERIGLVPLLLKDGARQWFEALQAGQAALPADSFDRIRESFQNHYKRDEVYKWKDSAAVWSTTQQPNQSVEDYFTKVLKKSMKANLSEEQTRFSLINGLKNNIRQAVLQHEPSSIQDIRRWAMIAESSGSEGESTDLAGAVKLLTEKIAKLTVQESSTTGRDKRAVSPRVSFEDQSRIKWTSPGRSSEGEDSRREQHWRHSDTQWESRGPPQFYSAGHGSPVPSL